jgi:hypothetical protein
MTINAQTVNLRGKVSNKAGEPIADAIVTLVGQDLKDTTKADGVYSIKQGDVSVLPLLQPQKRLISLDRGVITFSLPTMLPVMVEIFDIKGTLLKREIKPNAQAGFYRFNVAENARASKLLIINAFIDDEGVTFRYLPLYNGKYSIMNQSVVSSVKIGSKLAKITAIDDTIKVAAANYTEKAIAITSYDQELDITLDTAGGTGDVKPSAGCGKEATFSGEKRFSISAGSAGNREYIIRLPDDYDPNTPYKLWFSIHCMNGTATGVANQNGYEYYGIWKFANPKNGKGTTIFCSPQGISNAWGQGEKDLTFFRAMIAKFENELCIDESRIFAEGFSMGGSQSYALACAMPDTFRAVCMHSGGSMSGCNQSNRGPVPIFITHGTNDNVCRYPGYGVPQINDLAERDGCEAMDIPGTLKPTDGSGKTPVCADFKSCDPGYPCRACIFVGSHDYTPGGAANTWVDDSTWSWFSKHFY